ncbi:MAG: hypothetical protein FDZ72_13420 [Betaproteobacteria bacterium]|nr:MAG: hypothetical protein FDZ72_13420 [Betaproteobacteria bacterium]
MMHQIVVLGILLFSGLAFGQGGMVTPGSFSVSESGAATYSIPIRVPASTAGVEPKLALIYNSQGRNGLLGVGWGLSGLSSVTRCPRTQAQDGIRGSVNYDSNDRFCLDGQRLIAINGADGGDGTEYRTERESFSRIVSYGSVGNGPASFKAWTKAGLVMEFGSTADSAIEAPGKTILAIWAVNKVSDVRGNYYSVTYTEDATGSSYYPVRIDYVGNANLGVAPSAQLQFVYETRPDVVPLGGPGLISKMFVRLKRIVMHAPDLVRYLDLGYSTGIATGRSRLAFLKECDSSNNCLATTSLKFENTTPAPTNFTWTGGMGVAGSGWQMVDLFGDGRQLYYTHDTSGAHYATRLNPDGTKENWSWKGGMGVANAGWQMANLFGDGRQLYYTHDTSGAHYATRLNPDGTKENWSWKGGMGVANAGWQMANLFGDGRQLYYTHDTSGAHYATRLNPDGTKENWSWKGGMGVANAGWQMADLFGDGRQLYYTHDTSGAHYATRLNPDGTKENWSWKGGMGVANAGWQMADLFGDGRQLYYTHDTNGTHYATRLNPDGTKENWSWTGGMGVANAGWQMADLFGDGRQLYYTHDTNGTHYATRLNPDGTKENWSWTGGMGVANAGWQMADLFGDGRQLYYTHDTNGTHYATRLNPDGTKENWTWKGGMGVAASGWQLVDLFGDGRQLYYTHDTSGAHYATRLNPDGTKENWSWKGGMGVANADWQMADLFGDGRQLYYTHDTNGTHYATRFIDVQPDSVLRIENDLGSAVEITQIAATNSAISKGSESSYPIADIKLPIYVVTTVMSSNGVGSAVTSNYKYGGLKVEQGTGRGLLGFNWVESTQVETGVSSRTTYRQDWPYVGLPSQVTKSVAGGGNGGVLSQTDMTYDCLDPATGTACSVGPGKRYFPYVSKSVESGWDLNGAVLPVVTTTNSFDLWGNATQVTVSNSDGSSKTTTNTYVNDSTNWYLGRLIRSVVTSTAP